MYIYRYRSATTTSSVTVCSSGVFCSEPRTRKRAQTEPMPPRRTPVLTVYRARREKREVEGFFVICFLFFPLYAGGDRGDWIFLWDRKSTVNANYGHFEVNR